MATFVASRRPQDGPRKVDDTTLQDLPNRANSAPKAAIEKPSHRTVGSSEDELERQCLVSDMFADFVRLSVDQDQRQRPVRVAISNRFEMGGHDGLEPD